MPDKNPQTRINDLELTVRTIQEMLPELSTTQLQKWYSIGLTFVAHIEDEMKSTMLHTCKLCFFQEYGYRDELPNGWYGKGDSHICFQHEYEEAAKELKAMGEETDAFLPPDIPIPTVGSLRVQMENLPPPKDETEIAYEDLLAEL